MYGYYHGICLGTFSLCILVLFGAHLTHAENERGPELQWPPNKTFDLYNNAFSFNPTDGASEKGVKCTPEYVPTLHVSVQPLLT